MVSRGSTTLVSRTVAVWSVVTAGLAAGIAATPRAWHLADPATSRTDFADLLVAACATVLLPAMLWLWVVTTVTAVELVTGRLRIGGGTTRRLVLLACGAAALAGSTAPALASDDGASLLAGLSLPDRSVTTSRAHQPSAAERTPSVVPARPTQPARTHVVRHGESLWSIAEANPAAESGVDQRWRAIWSANRDVIGDDPDLIIPGQQLRLPAHDETDDNDNDTNQGDRR